MSENKGFTLIEVLVVLIIIGLLVAIALPNYNTYTQQAAANAAQNNLISIYDAQKNYYLSPTGSGRYCRSTGPLPRLCGNLTSINTNLALNITDNNFGYRCVNDASGFSCRATNNSSNRFVLTLTNNPLVLPGASGSLNPSCTYPAHPNYCPS